MRKATFEVPTEVIGEFAERLAQTNLENQITGTTEDNEILIEVNYERDETDEADSLEEYLEELKEAIEEEEEEEED